MKKLLLLLIILLSISCDYKYNPDKTSIIIVTSIENSSNSKYGLYKYTLLTSSSDKQKTYLFSDSIYKLNDTLIITKK